MSCTADIGGGSALVDDGTRDYHIKRAPPPTIALSCGGWALAAFLLEGMAGAPKRQLTARGGLAKFCPKRTDNHYNFTSVEG